MRAPRLVKAHGSVGLAGSPSAVRAVQKAPHAAARAEGLGLFPEILEERT